MQDYSKTCYSAQGMAIRKFSALLPGVMLAGAITFDATHLLTFSILSVTCVFSLLIFSFFLPSRQMIGWTVLYLLSIVVTLWVKRNVWAGASGNVEALVATRTLVAAAAGVLACLLARHRERNDLIISEVQRLLNQLEIPVFTSNRDGWLIHMNPKASALLGGEAALGSPFFKHFSVIETKGRAIQDYVNLATGVCCGPNSIELALGPQREEMHSAVMLRVDIGHVRQILTLVYPAMPPSNYR